MSETTWPDLVEKVNGELSNRGLNGVYEQRLKFEIAEVEKQGSETYWLNLVNDKKLFDSNPNRLLLPWLLGMVEGDPMEDRSTPLLCTARASNVMAYQQEHGRLPEDFVKDADMPDIDIDCLPDARNPIKEYATEKYGRGNNDGYGSVCSVGTWQTYKFKSALIDSAVAMGFMDRYQAEEVTTQLPDDVDDLRDNGMATCKGRIKEDGEDRECGNRHRAHKCPKCDSTSTDAPTIGKVLAEHDILREFAKAYDGVVDVAVGLVGRIRNMGMHAGALIITDRPLFGNVPMAKNARQGYWLSMWTEGRNTQLSKFGYTKWDILGLKTLEYIFNACKLIEDNRGISFGKPVESRLETEVGDIEYANMSGWDDIDPTQGRAGHFYDADGQKREILLNDEWALKLANEQKTDAVFQFDTDLAKSILANGVRNFNDLMLFNAMGHPGPMASIPDAVKNRDDKSGAWKRKLHPDILKILEPTYGVIVFQEQLQAIWQAVAGFTSPEAQDARKAVAKKWTHKLKPIKEKWIVGATRSLGRQEAEEWWPKMETFGRYAFNKSHSVSYCLVAHRCLWLKAHFAPEWWAAVMSDCHPKKLIRYMGVARAEGWEPTEYTYSGTYRPKEWAKGVDFSTLNLSNLTVDFTVNDDTVNQGMIGIKGIGESAADKFCGKGEYTDIDDFIEKKGKSKLVLERLIKLGAFKSFPGHENSYALWQYYRYKYCTGKDITALKQEIRGKLLEIEGWSDAAIIGERQRQINEYRQLYPNRRKIPAKFENWNPTPKDGPHEVMALYPNDFEPEEVLKFQLDYFGYYIDSPMSLYVRDGGGTIAEAKACALAGETAKIEALVHDIKFAKTKHEHQYGRLTIDDGIQKSLVFIWPNELAGQDPNCLVPGTGIQLYVDYDKDRNTFSLVRHDRIRRLKAQPCKSEEKE